MPEDPYAKYGGAVAEDPYAKYGGATGTAPPNASKLTGPMTAPAPTPVEGSGFGRLLHGAWDTAAGVVGGAGQAIKAMASGNPYDQMQFGAGVVQGSVDQAKKAKESWDKGQKTEAFGHALGATPLIGPAAAHAGERAGGTETTFDKYGNVVEQGKGSDVWGGVGEGGALIALSSPKNLTEPVVSKTGGALATAADRMGVPNGLERSAGKSYRKMLTPTAKDVVPEAEAVAGGPSENGPTGLVKQRPVAMTRKGMMAKQDAVKAEVGPKTSTVYDDKPPLDPQPILDHLESIRRQRAVIKDTDVVSDPGLNSAIDELQENIQAMRGPDGKVSARSLDDLKDKLNRGNVSPKGHMRALPPQSAANIEKSTAGRIGSYLDTAYPDAAKVNAEYHTAASTNNFLEQQRRAEIAAESGVRTGSSSGFGAALKKMVPGPLRGIPNAISALTDSVAWDSVSGASKAKIAELIRAGSWDTAAEAMRPLPKLLTQGDIVTPKPRDASGVRSIPAMTQPPNPRRALPPARTIEIPPSSYSRSTGETLPQNTGAASDASYVRSIPAELGEPASPEDIDGLASEFQKRRVRFPDLRGPGQVR